MILALFLLLVLFFVVFPLIGMALWALVSTLIVGLVIGALGRLVVPGYQRIGVLATFLSGLCGALLGGFLGNHVFRIGGFATVLVEVGVAAALVAALAATTTRKAHGLDHRV